MRATFYVAALTTAACLVAAPARAATYTGPRAQWMTWQEATAKEPGPAGAITLRSGLCPDTGATACADTDGDQLWLSESSQFAAAHERGHFFDARNLDDWERGELQALMNVSMTKRWEHKRSLEGQCGVKQCPSEMFADAYANCALGRSPAGKRHAHGRVTGGWESPYGYNPTPMEFHAMCDSIRLYA